MEPKFLCFGELLGRLSPEGDQRILQTNRFSLTYSGSEANVAMLLGNLGMDVSYVTKLPQNDVGEAALRALRAHNVQTGHVLRGGARMGLYFVEKGMSARTSNLIYDRAGSSFATISPDELDWDELFRGVTHFHFTGITPALSDACAQACLDACRAAKEKQIVISCDLNYRAKLWSVEKANAVLATLLPYVDILLSNNAEIEQLFGIHTEKYEELADELQKRFGIESVGTAVYSIRDHGTLLDWAGVLSYKGQLVQSRNRYTIQVLDPIGGGDSFSAAVLYGLARQMPLQECVDFATAASVLKFTISGDVDDITPADVQKLLHSKDFLNR